MKGFIYKISSPSTDKIYIGSTIVSLKKRFKHHRCTNTCSSYEIISCGDAICELVEEYEYEDILNLRKRERYYIELNQDKCVNISIPTIGLVESRAKYYLKHIDAVKLYRDENADKIAAVKKIWYDKNQERIEGYKEQRNRSVQCECGGIYTYSNKKRHINSTLHKSFLKV